MHQKGEGSKRQLFLDKMTAQQPIQLSNLPTSSSGTIFLNKGAVIQDVPSHSVQFQHMELTTNQVTKISDLDNHSSGTFTVSGVVQWNGPPQKPTEESTKLVRDATITDSSGLIKLSVWEEHIDQINEGDFYTITNCKLRYFYGKCLSTTRATTVTEAVKQDVSAVQQKTENVLCCPEILNTSVNVYPVCNNKDCKKKINGNPGSRLVKCLSCNRSMLVQNCYLDTNVSLQLEKGDKTISVTAFPKVLATFFNEDIYSYKDNTEALIEKILLLESVDFQLSQNGRLVTKMVSHN